MSISIKNFTVHCYTKHELSQSWLKYFKVHNVMCLQQLSYVYYFINSLVITFTSGNQDQ